jgi:hypothetical protein
MTPEDADFSDEFCQFLQSAVPAVEAAELLLVLRRETARAWTVADAVAALGAGVSLPEEVASRYLEELQARGLVAFDAAKKVQYRPASDALAAHVATLEKVYRERPVTLIRVIYGLRDSKIRSFADAFRLRRK